MHEAAFSFRHILIRDAAYRTVAKKLRAELHERFAKWLSRVAGDRLTEYEEILGYHLEQAYQYRVQLGPLDEASRALARTASKHLEAAAGRAFDRGDARAAASLYDRGASLLVDDRDARLALLPALSEALGESDQIERGVTVAAEVIEAADASELDRARATVAKILAELHAPPEGLAARAHEELDSAADVLGRASDERWLARASQAMARAYALVEDRTATGRCLAEAARHAHRAGDRRYEAKALSYLTAETAWEAAIPVQAGLRRCEETLSRTADVLEAKANTLANFGLCVALDGRLDDARALFGEARGLYEDLARGWESCVVAQNAGYAELLSGDPAAAAAELDALCV